MTTTEPSVTLGAGTIPGRPTEVREVPLNVEGAPDIRTGMKTLSPSSARLLFRRRWQGEAWGPWVAYVHVTGPRRLTSGELSARSRVEVTFRADAAEGSTLAVPDYLRAHVEAWRPTDTRSTT